MDNSTVSESSFSNLQQPLEIVLQQLQQPIFTASLALIIILVVATKVLTGDATPQPASHNGAKSPRMVSYWIPYIGHIPQAILGFDGFLASISKLYPESIFSLRLMGSVHNIIHSPSLAGQLLGQPTAASDPWIHWTFMLNVFGFCETREMYDAVFFSGDPPYKHITSEPGLGEMTNSTIEHVKRDIADFVTFNSHDVDRTEWERQGGAETIRTPSGETVVEAELFDLTKTFMGITSGRSIWGTDFIENFPEVWSHFWAFDRGFMTLAAGLPFWFPWPAAWRAHAARRKVIACLREYDEAMEKRMNGEDAGAQWQNLDNVSRLMKWRSQQYHDHGMAMAGRATADLSFLWASNANVSPAVGWMLAEMYRDPVLLEEVREEIAPFVVVRQPESEEFHGAVWVSPQVERFDLEGLMGRCPLLKSCYVEALRVYTHSWSARWLHEDVMLKERGGGGGRKEKGNGEGREETYLLKKGTYAHVNQDLHHFDAKYFESPNEFRATRHITEKVDGEGKTVKTADLGTVKPYSK